MEWSKDKSEVTLDSFKIHGILGKGAFGVVNLAELNDEFYAIKKMRKDKIIDSDTLQNCLNEKHIMLDFEHPFLGNMDFIF